jgi:S1-C subfamily serine protease
MDSSPCEVSAMSYEERSPWTHPVRPNRRPPSTSFLVPLLTLLGVLVVLIGGLFAYRGFQSWREGRGVNPDATPRTVTPAGDLTALEKANIEIYQRNRSSVVHITTLVQQSNFFGSSQVPAGTGSGFVWDDEGHVVTNFHVIRDANAARVYLIDNDGNKTSYRAWFVGGRPEKDLAVLWIDAPKSLLRPILVGSSHDLKVGQFTYAIGNPYGLDQTFSMGIVSALGREIDSLVEGRRIKNVIQTDAAINPGNSGGPLLDSFGRLIGVNTAIYSQSGSSAGIGFAIPVDTVNEVVPELIRKGKGKKPSEPERRKSRPGMGIQVASDDLARQHGVEEGVIIARVLPGTPASRAGLVAAHLDEDGNVVLGDIVVGIDDIPVKAVNDLFGVLKKHRVGDKVTLKVLRKGGRTSMEITLGEVQ